MGMGSSLVSELELVDDGAFDTKDVTNGLSGCCCFEEIFSVCIFHLK